MASATLIICLIAILILVGLCIYFIFNSVSIQSRYIDPNNCPRQTTEFGASSFTVGNTILNQCGSDRQQICTFTNVGNLNEAMNLCRQYADICTVFSYAPGVIVIPGSPPQGIMSIMSSTAGLSSSTIYDTYTQQIFSNLTN